MFFLTSCYDFDLFIFPASVILKPITIASQKEGGGKKEAKVSGYVSPGKARYFTLPSETLFKTENVSIQVRSQYTPSCEIAVGLKIKEHES
jgi:P pilus assembly chaperone PapD